LRSSISILLVSLYVSVVNCQIVKYSNDFLSVGVGARALSMAGSVVASADDVTSGYWNPAGLTQQDHTSQVCLMHNEYFAGMGKYDYGAFSLRLDEKSAAGISFLRFGIDDILNTLDLIDANGNISYDRITKFSVADYGLILSYGRISGIEGLFFGGNLKLIYRKTGDFANAWGFGFDAGAKYKMDKWHFGAVIRDITSTFNIWNFNTSQMSDVFEATGNVLPENSLELTMPRLIIGGAREFSLSGKFALLTEVNADITFDGKRHVLIGTRFMSIDPHLGIEFNYGKIIYLRLGTGNIQLIPDIDKNKSFDFQPALGLGVRFKNFAIDYALTDLGDQAISLYSNVFSLAYSFNLPQSHN
jgi:Type IX secretion system protein PorV